MATYKVRLVLFLSSYAPLQIIFALLLFASDHREAAYALVLTASLSILTLITYLKLATRMSLVQLKVASALPRDSDAMSYIVTYLLPFFQIDFTRTSTVIALLGFVVILATLYVNSNLIYINPVLNLFGYHLFEVETSEGEVMVLLTQRNFVRRSRELSVVKLGQFVALEKRS